MASVLNLITWHSLGRKSRLLRPALLLAAALLIFVSGQAAAASITVTSTADSGAGSLRQAILDANAGDTILFDTSLAGQTIALASELAVNKALTIDGSAAPNLTVSGGNSVRVFYATAPLTLTGFTVAGGQAPPSQLGGGIFTNQTLTFTRMRLANNQASSGGGLYLSSGGSASITESTFTGNSSVNAGGAIFASGNSVTINSSVIYSNTAADGGGILVDNGSLMLHNSTVSGNSASGTAPFGRGGGVWASITNATIQYSTIANNSASNTGGGLFVQTGGNVALDSTIIAYSTSGGACVGVVSGPGYNFIDDAANACGLVDGQNNDFVGQDPVLASLGDYGGPTWTHAGYYRGNLPNHGNPATCPATDQRGFARPRGPGCDAGALESDTYPFGGVPTPDQLATDIPMDTDVVVVFDEPVHAPANAFTLECPVGTPVAFYHSMAADNMTVTLDPVSNLPANTTCRLTQDLALINDLDTDDPPDNGSGVVITSDFTTGNTTSDQAPALLSVTPANSATNVPVDTTIIFTFSEAVTGPTNGFTIECPVGTPVAFTDLGANTNTRTLFPSSALPYNTTCQVTIQADAISDMDSDDPPDHLAADFVTSFTTVAPPSPTAPIIFGTPNVQAVAGVLYTFEPGAVDADGDLLSFGIQNQPAWASFDPATGVLSGTPAADDVGLTAGIVISVTDGDHTAALPAFNLTVVASFAEINQSPFLQNVQAPHTANVGQLYYFDPGGVDPDGDPLVYEIENKPSWASFDPQTGILQGTPTSDDVGAAENIVIRVSEAGTVGAAQFNTGGSAGATLNVQVSDPNSPVQPARLDFCINDPAAVEAKEVVIKAQPGWGPFWGLFGPGYIQSEKQQLTGDTYLLKVRLDETLLENMAHGFDNPYSTTMKPTFARKQDLALPVTARLSDACEKPNLLLLGRKKLGFTAVLGQDTQLSQNLTIEGSTGINLAWTAKVEPSGNRNSFLVSPPSGVVKEGSPATLELFFFPAEATIGRQANKLVLTDQNGKVYEVVIDYEVKTASNSFDMSLTALEVTQGMQNLRNAMPLVQDRPTFVRAHVRSKGALLSNATAKLTVKRENGAVLGTLYPANEGMSINVAPNPDRNRLNDSFLFELKPQWLNGTLVLEFAGSSSRAECQDINNTPNDCRATVSFRQVPPLPVTFFLCTQTYGPDNAKTTYSGTMAEVQQVIQLLETFFPTPRVNWTSAPWSVNYRVLNSSERTRALDDLQALWRKNGSPRSHYFALCSHPEVGIQGRGGQAYLDRLETPGYLDLPLAVFSGFNSIVVAHEFQHNYGYAHPGEKQVRPYPYYAQNFSISEKYEKGDPDAYYGFVIKNNLFKPGTLHGDRVIPALLSNGQGGWSSKDPVAYGQWLSDYTYREILGLMPTIYSTSGQAVASATAETPITLVSGWVTDTTSAQLTSVYGQVAQGTVSLPEAGDYALRLERADGTVVQTIPFGLQEPPEDMEHNPPAQRAAATSLGEFNFAIPYDLNQASDIAKIVLLYQGNELDSITAPPGGAPDISGMLLSSQTTSATVEVTAEVVVFDTQPLRFWLEYQPAGSEVWHLVGSGNATPDAMGQAAFSVVIDTASLPGAGSHRWRLLVNNGFYTSRSETTATFVIPDKPPITTMFTDFRENMVVGDQTLVLKGSGFDLEDGELTGESLGWYSNLDGKIGTGEALLVDADALREGEHILWLEAIDSADNSSILTGTTGLSETGLLLAAEIIASQETPSTFTEGVNQTAVAFVQVYRDRPYRASGLEATGFNLVLTQGATGATALSIRNSGDGGVLDWTVTADRLPTWVTLSQSSGQTPQEIVVTADASGVAAGVYTGTLNFQSSNAILNKTVTVPYAVEVLAPAAPQTIAAQPQTMCYGESITPSIDLQPGAAQTQGFDLVVVSGPAPANLFLTGAFQCVPYTGLRSMTELNNQLVTQGCAGGVACNAINRIVFSYDGSYRIDTIQEVQTVSDLFLPVVQDACNDEPFCQ